MIITGAVHVDRVTAHFPYLRSEGYTPLLAYPGNSKELTSRKNFSWETLLKGVVQAEETSTQEEDGEARFQCF
ncbi:hypothetical protein Bca4012_089125 [Brassica carinata]